jgi:hypothetical protein
MRLRNEPLGPECTGHLASLNGNIYALALLSDFGQVITDVCDDANFYIRTMHPGTSLAESAGRILAVTKVRGRVAMRRCMNVTSGAFVLPNGKILLEGSSSRIRMCRKGAAQ